MDSHTRIIHNENNVNSEHHLVLPTDVGFSSSAISSSFTDTLRKPISALRRTFCLVILFDMVITMILWIVFTEMKSQQPMEEFRNQTIGYTFQTSFFDTVVLAVFRFLFLITAYALFKSSKPWSVAITTCVTSVFMLCKAIYYQYDKGKGESSVLEIFDYIMIISAFIISWVEAWLMDLKVLEHERKELVRVAERSHHYSEYSPLLPPGARTNDDFYSPAGSDVDDDDRRSYHSIATHRSRPASLPSSLDQILVEQYLKQIKDAQEKALAFLDSSDWTKEIGSDPAEGLVFCRQTKEYGKIYKLTAEVNIEASRLMDDLINNASDMPKWDTTLLEVKVLQVLDEQTDVCYNVAAEAAAGMVSSRDFVYIRHWEVKDDFHITSSVSTEYPAMPPRNKYVRGEQGPSALRFRNIGENKVQLEWLCITNLKGWLPQVLIDRALSGALLTYLDSLKKHAIELRN